MKPDIAAALAFVQKHMTRLLTEDERRRFAAHLTKIYQRQAAAS